MTNSGGSPGLETVRRVYATWGRHPRLYAAQDWLTFLGRHQAIRRRAVEAIVGNFAEFIDREVRPIRVADRSEEVSR